MKHSIQSAHYRCTCSSFLFTYISDAEQATGEIIIGNNLMFKMCSACQCCSFLNLVKLKSTKIWAIESDSLCYVRIRQATFHCQFFFQDDSQKMEHLRSSRWSLRRETVIPTGCPKKQALRNSCELLRQRKELHASLGNCMQAHVTACKLM